MISKKTLQNAAEKNIINKDQIEPLYQFILNEQTELLPENKEEPLKFIRSFGDIFIALGVVLLVIAINMTSISGYYYLLPAAGFILIAEWLVRVRRLALPGIFILLSILYFISKSFAVNYENISFSEQSIISLGVISLCSLLFYLRYKMPFSLLPFAASLVAIIIIQTGLDALNNPVIFVILGFSIFCCAMWFDSRDTQRQSYLSDSAFWLHLLASPLMVHGALLPMLTSDQAWLSSMSNDILMILFFAVFFLTALFVDRRAMLVSTQLYAIYALTQLFGSDLIAAGNVMIYVLMVLGMLVIFFGTYWYKTRRLVFGFLANWPISRYVPDLKLLDTEK